MTLIYSVILFLLFKVRSCQLQCVKETPNVSEFSFNVTTHIEVESGDCIWIPYELTFPKDKVPHRTIWFGRDPHNTETVQVVSYVESGTEHTFMIEGLPHGEYEYGLKLEWECNQTYIFPNRVRISVSASTKKPTVVLPDHPMTEGQAAILECVAPYLCADMGNVYWRGTNAYESTALYDYDGDYLLDGFNHGYMGMRRLVFTPTADDHNTNITCVAKYDYNIIETTVTLTVKFAPKILNGSQCVDQGNLLVCVCISRGNPPPPITWPSLTDFSVTSSSGIQTVTSTITMPAADFHNTTVTCISTNELGRDETEIPVQNYTETLKLSSELDSTPTSDAVVPWTIAGLSLILNLLLLTSLIIYHKRGKTQQGRKEPGAEMNTYASLNRADVASVYSVISPQNRYIT